MNRSRSSLLVLVALLLASAALTSAPVGAAEANPTGPGVLRLEIVGAGFEPGDGSPPAPASFVVRNLLNGATLASPSSSQLTASSGGACPGVGSLCTGDVPLTVATLGTELHVSVAQGPTDRLAVYSGDCDGGATVQNLTSGRVRLAVGQTKVCRVTFVRPDQGGVADADTGLLVGASFDFEPLGVGRPNQQLDLRGGSTSIATTSMDRLTDASNPTARCPLAALRPQCEWAVTYDQDDHQVPVRVVASPHPDWLPIFGGACDAGGNLPTDHALGGELVRCSLENVRLESQDGSSRNAALRVEIIAPAGAGSPTAAAIDVRSFPGDPLADIETFQMTTSAGQPCPGIAGTTCSGDVGLTVHTSHVSSSERYTLHLTPSSSGAVPAFSGACSTRTPVTGLPFGEIELSVGALATCRVTLTVPSPPPPPPVLTIGDLKIGEGNSGTNPASVRIGLSAASSQPVSVSVSTANGTAGAPGDFSSVAGPVTIPAGQTSFIVPVPIVGDVVGEPDETFTVRLASPTGATIGDSTAVVTIVNDDDRTPPVIGAKTTVVAESKTGPVAVVYAPPSATDSVDGSVKVSCVAKSGSAFAFGTTTVTCSAVDQNGNASTSAFNVLVRLPTTSGAVTQPGQQATDPLQVVHRRQLVQVDAGGFGPGSRIELVFITADGEQVPLARTRAGEDGRIDLVVRIPLVPLGDGQMTAIGSAADGSPLVRAWRLTVVEPAPLAGGG